MVTRRGRAPLAGRGAPRASEGAVRLGAEVQEVADERQRARSRGQVEVNGGEETQEVQGGDDEDGAHVAKNEKEIQTP